MDDSPSPQTSQSTELQTRTEWFTSTPDPWVEIARLAHGGDRTHASTVSREILSAEPAHQAAMEQRLIAVLADPELTGAGRLFVCRMLAWIGTAACVPAVAPLLESDRTADVARLALDEIRDATVDAAYRSALDKLHGSAKAGLIGSIGLRGDRAAAEALAAIAENAKEAEVVRVAARRALERIEATGAEVGR